MFSRALSLTERTLLTHEKTITEGKKIGAVLGEEGSDRRWYFSIIGIMQKSSGVELSTPARGRFCLEHCLGVADPLIPVLQILGWLGFVLFP